MQPAHWGLLSKRATIYCRCTYKGSYVEVIDSTSGAIDIRSEITTFTAVNALATITGTPTDGDYYGTVSELPEEGMAFVVLDATLLALAKPGASLDTKYFSTSRCFEEML